MQFWGHQHADTATFTLALELNKGEDILLERAEDRETGAERSNTPGIPAANGN